MAIKKNRESKIPEVIQEQVTKIVLRFNKQVLKPPDYRYVPRFEENYLFLDRYEFGRLSPICRLKYHGQMENWGFAIYRYSIDRYDPEEWWFPGSELVDGTVEGAMKAGLEAYK
ncbi:MAG: hypothetical protein V1799_06330 [bacterium]